jgi:hypothetical protein
MTSAIPLSLVALRSQLQFISSEFDNLTVAELKTLKFSLIQRVFVELMLYSPLLREQGHCERCMGLIERRTGALKHLNKEARVELEAVHKLQFMSEVQALLAALGWPPSMEPFADTLTPLMTEPSVVVSAIEFLIATVLPTASPRIMNSSRQSPPRETSTKNKMSPGVRLESNSNTKPDRIPNVKKGTVSEAGRSLRPVTASRVSGESVAPAAMDYSRDAYEALLKSFKVTFTIIFS